MPAAARPVPARSAVPSWPSPTAGGGRAPRGAARPPTGPEWPPSEPWPLRAPARWGYRRGGATDEVGLPTRWLTGELVAGSRSRRCSEAQGVTRLRLPARPARSGPARRWPPGHRVGSRREDPMATDGEARSPRRGAGELAPSKVGGAARRRADGVVALRWAAPDEAEAGEVPEAGPAKCKVGLAVCRGAGPMGAAGLPAEGAGGAGGCSLSLARPRCGEGAPSERALVSGPQGPRRRPWSRPRVPSKASVGPVGGRSLSWLLLTRPRRLAESLAATARAFLGSGGPPGGCWRGPAAWHRRGREAAAGEVACRRGVPGLWEDLGRGGPGRAGEVVALSPPGRRRRDRARMAWSWQARPSPGGLLGNKPCRI